MTLAILSALPEEQHGLLDLLHAPVCVRHAGRDFWQGTWHGTPVVLALAGIGKVAAATTATVLVERLRLSVSFSPVWRVAWATVYGWVTWWWPRRCCSTTWTRHRCSRALKCRCTASRTLRRMQR